MTAATTHPSSLCSTWVRSLFLLCPTSDADLYFPSSLLYTSTMYRNYAFPSLAQFAVRYSPQQFLCSTRRGRRTGSRPRRAGTTSRCSRTAGCSSSAGSTGTACTTTCTSSTSPRPRTSRRSRASASTCSAAFAFAFADAQSPEHLHAYPARGCQQTHTFLCLR